MFAQMQKNGVDIKPFFKVLLNFFKKLFAKFLGLVNSLKAFMDKGLQHWETNSDLLLLYVQILDDQSSLFTFFIKKANTGNEDASDMIMMLTSQFIKKLKQKSELVKQQEGEVRSHLFYIKILTQLQETANSQLKKTSQKMKKALDVTIASSMKVYLLQCWSGVVALSTQLSKEKEIGSIEDASKFKFLVVFFNVCAQFRGIIYSFRLMRNVWKGLLQIIKDWKMD